ncbi:MAG: DUF1244 domain-containing protein [Thiohalomonadales bacterium]
MDEQTRLELEAAAFRGLIHHLQQRSDVQNIDLMNLSGFCRNCLSKWYLSAAEAKGIDMDYESAREVVYGMPFQQWKHKFQKKASPAQMEAFEKSKSLHADISGHNK